MNEEEKRAYATWLIGQHAKSFEEGWETGYKTVESEAAERAESFRGIHEKTSAAETAEKIAWVLEECADDLTPPITTEWLELRDWFKDQLHAMAARAREIGGVE